MQIDNLYLRISILVPGADCDTFDDWYDNMAWRDIRTKPTEAELLAITEADVELYIKRRTMKCSASKFRRALTSLGHRGAVESAINSRGQDAKDVWDFENEFLRNGQLTVQLTGILGLTEIEMDAIFDLAISLDDRLPP